MCVCFRPTQMEDAHKLATAAALGKHNVELAQLRHEGGILAPADLVEGDGQHGSGESSHDESTPSHESGTHQQLRVR